jgi:hypothetical protein
MKNDITEYGDGELSMVVFNDIGFYNDRHSPALRDMVEELFIFTEEQWQELENDLADDLEEMEKYIEAV